VGTNANADALSKNNESQFNREPSTIHSALSLRVEEDQTFQLTLAKAMQQKSNKVAGQKTENKESIYSIYDKKEDTFEEFAV